VKPILWALLGAIALYRRIEMDNWTYDYLNAKRIARYWAKIAISNKKEGLPWKEAAKNAHDAFFYSILIS